MSGYIFLSAPECAVLCKPVARDLASKRLIESSLTSRMVLLASECANLVASQWRGAWRGSIQRLPRTGGTGGLRGPSAFTLRVPDAGDS